VAAVGFVVSLLAEETSLTADATSLSSWASAGGGGLDAAPETWLRIAGKTRERATDISQWAMILAAAVFAFDVIVRRWPAFATFLATKRERA